MQYHDALKELRKFANEPLEAGSLTVKRTADIRMSVRTLLKTLDLKGDINHQRASAHISVRQERPKSRREKIVDMIREAGSKGLPEVEIYAEFRISANEIRKEIGNSYGIVSYTLDDRNHPTFYYICDNMLQLNENHGGKVPKDHKIVDPRGYYK